MSTRTARVDIHTLSVCCKVLSFFLVGIVPKSGGNFYQPKKIPNVPHQEKRASSEKTATLLASWEHFSGSRATRGKKENVCVQREV